MIKLDIMRMFFTAYLRVTHLRRFVLLFIFILSAVSCASSSTPFYSNPNMDFQSIRTAAVMPFQNLTREQLAADRVRDVFSNMLLSTSEIYVMPPGEVYRGILITGIANPVIPSPEEIIKLAAVIKVDVIITGTVKEYGEVRSGTSSANLISISLQMIEASTGKTIWSASTTRGGITLSDRLLGGGGEPMNDITEKAVRDIIEKILDLR
ncbi:MAG: penicillin-binding protein activator LpoB [Nitrospirota bacterium]